MNAASLNRQLKRMIETLRATEGDEASTAGQVADALESAQGIVHAVIVERARARVEALRAQISRQGIDFAFSLGESLTATDAPARKGKRR